MRGLRSTLALIVVLAGLSSYIYFITWKKPENDTGSKQEKVFASLQADKINDLRIKSESGDTTALKKSDAGWQVVEPASMQADEAELSAITASLTQIEIVRVIDEHPADLKDYGLNGPRIEVDFKTAGDNDYRRLLIGDKSPTGADLFVKRNGETRVFLIPAYMETNFNRTTFDLRDKTLLKFDRDKVGSVEVNAGGKIVQIAKDGSEWKITKPLQARADFGAVEGLIGRVQTARMRSLVTNEPSAAELKKYGLDKPETTLQMTVGSAKATLLVGGKADDNAVYARDTSRPTVMTMESTIADDLKKNADEYRRKDIFAFRAYTANRMEMTRAGPNAGDVDNDKVAALLAKLEGMRALSFVESMAKTGLESPVMSVVAKFEDGKKEDRVTFGKSGDNVYAGRPDEPGAGKVDAADFNDVVSKLDELSK